MHQQICLACFIERALKRFHQVGGQFSDKAHGVGQEERQIFDDDFAHGGIKRGKQFVLCKHFALGQKIYQRAFAHIGIAHQGHTNESAAIFALCGFLLVDFRQSLLKQRHSVQDDAAVHLELRFTRTAQTHRAFATATARTASLAFQVGPQSLQTRQHVSILRQLHLRLGIGGLSTHGKDVENQAGAIQNLYLEFFLDVAKLLGRQFVVKNHHTHFAFGFFFRHNVAADFLQLSFSYIGYAAGAVESLCETLHRNGTGRLGKKFQFVQVFLRLAFVLRLCDECHEHSGLGFGFALYEFFHWLLSVNFR